MEFRLIYQGPLPAEKCKEKGAFSGPVGRAKEKHQLRKYFHLQLRELWKQHPDLRRQAAEIPAPPSAPSGVKTWLEYIAEGHRRCNNNRFIPLISHAGGFTCSLSILFLRRDNPGNLITSGGDVDNRIKVLFDGLRMPIDVKELGGLTREQDEDPFYCLLEDDKLITSVSITTDRLIVPQRTDENINDVILVIHVAVVNPSQIFAGGRLV